MTAPVLGLAMFVVWLQDFHGPFYFASRVGRGGHPFTMVKLRSMTVRADSSGVVSTTKSDPRITRVGRFVRRWKLDELPQLWNVLVGDMSLVGPRPQVPADVAKYTPVERRMLDVRPGITDFASIVFADEADILEGAADPNARYDEVIRPWKSRLALLYVERGRKLWIDVALIILTAVAIVSRRRALAGVSALVRSLGGEERLVRTALRETSLDKIAPPGADPIATES